MKKKRWFSIILSLALLVSMLSNTVLAAQDSGAGNETVCTVSEDCMAQAHEAGCPKTAGANTKWEVDNIEKNNCTVVCAAAILDCECDSPC